MTDEVFPVKPGDWLVNEGERVAQVKAVYQFDGEILVDLYLYNNYGEKTGRESPILGGPRTYEPCCPFVDWSRIAKPEFPITLKAIPIGDGKFTYRYYAGERLPNRAWIKPVRKAKVARPLTMRNFDPELEARSRVLAAQMLRDAARKHNTPALLAEAERLEAEAKSLRQE
jgi:hypothetical protein